MIVLQERIDSFSTNYAMLLVQLNELNRLQEQVRQAQALAQKSINLESVSPKRTACRKSAR